MNYNIPGLATAFGNTGWLSVVEWDSQMIPYSTKTLFFLLPVLASKHHLDCLIYPHPLVSQQTYDDRGYFTESGVVCCGEAR